MPPSKKTSTKTATPAPVFTPAQSDTVPCEVVATPCVAVAEPCVAVAEQCEAVAEPCEVESVAEPILTSGCVKWFNNKAGYGFITVNDCETNEERDMFVHHSEIKVEQTQYKYLVQGEYVEFVIGAISRENKIDVHATNVRGINGGRLMCETRNEVRLYRSTQGQQVQQTSGRPFKQAQQSQAQQSQQSQQSRGQQAQQSQTHKQRTQDRRPQLTQEDQTEWMVVPRRRTETVPSKQRNHPRQRQPEIEIQN